MVTDFIFSRQKNCRKLKKTRTFVVAKISCNKMRRIQLNHILFQFFFKFHFPSDGGTPGYVNQRASFVYSESLWCRQSVHSIPRESWTEGVYGLHSEISLGFAYVVIPLSFECNDARYFRIKKSFPIATFGGLQISLKVWEAIQN